MEISIVTSAQLCTYVYTSCLVELLPQILWTSEREEERCYCYTSGWVFTPDCSRPRRLCDCGGDKTPESGSWVDTNTLITHPRLHSSECRLEQRSGGQRTDSFGLVTKTIDSIKHMRREISSISSVACLLAQSDFYLDTLFLLRMVYTHICAVAILPHLHVGWWNMYNWMMYNVEIEKGKNWNCNILEIILSKVRRWG